MELRDIPAVQPAKARSAAARPVASRSKAAPLLFLLCLVVAVAAVLFVPMFVGGATSASFTASASVAPAAPPQPTAQQSFSSLSQAAEALSFTPLVPSETPEGYGLSAIRGLSGGILEMEYSNGRSTILYRTAPGSNDLSGNTEEFAYTATEENGGPARSYAGASQQKLSLAVWAQGDASYSIYAENGLPAAQMRAMAESIG